MRTVRGSRVTPVLTRVVAACAFALAIPVTTMPRALAACPDVAGYIHDSFTAPDAAWTRGAVSSGGGTLSFPLKPDTVAWAVNHVDYPAGDATVCTVVNIDAAHAKEEEAGLAFWMDFSTKQPSFYTFTISPSGYVSVANRDSAGRYRTLLRKKHPALRAAAGAANELRAIVRNGTVKLVLNGSTVGTIAGKAPAANWYPGLFAISPDKKSANWHFTQFSLSP